MTRVLVALDDSPVSMRAARTARALFAAEGTEFIVINVMRVPLPWVPVGGYGDAWPMDPLLWDQIDADARERERRELRDEAEHAGLPNAETLLESGDPAHAIVRAAEDHDVDVIVVGSHDKGLVRRLWDRSVADGVVHGTSRPVLVVGAPPDAH